MDTLNQIAGLQKDLEKRRAKLARRLGKLKALYPGDVEFLGVAEDFVTRGPNERIEEHWKLLTEICGRLELWEKKVVMQGRSLVI